MADLSDEGMELYTFVSQASGIDHLAAQLSRLEPEERTRFAAVMKKEGKALKALWEKKGHEGRALLLAAHLNPTPSQLVTAMTGWALDNLSHGGGAEHLCRVVRDRGQEWGTAFVQAALKKSSVVQAAPALLNSLIDEFGLPLPETPTFWRAWVDHDPSPRPGTRWQERFIRACQTPGAFTDDWYEEPHPGAVAEALREIEDRDEDALVAALLSVIERDDSPACQRRALWWLDHLGLADRLWDHRRTLIRCLVMAERSVAKRIVEVCLRPELEGDDWDAFAVTVLLRPEKTARRQVLKELLRRDSAPSAALSEIVEQLAAEPDTTTAALAKQVLERWGVVPEPEQLRGLWQEPAGREDVPTDHDAVLDPSSLAELLTRVEQLDEDDPELAERTLAALIAAAHDRGAVRIRHAIRTSLRTDLDRGPALRRLLANLARKGEEGGRVRTHKLPGLTFLIGQRISEALNALGEVPCLLSTPSHHDFRVSWEAFRDRARRYRETGAAALPVDVAVALARLDRDAVPELTEFAQPIAGLEVSLADVLTHWAAHPAAAGELTVAPPQPGKEDSHYFHERVRADGDAPTSHELLGLRNAWTLPATFIKWNTFMDQELDVCSLLPEHPTRPIALALACLSRSDTDLTKRLGWVARTAHELGPIGAFALLAAASEVAAKYRPEVAYALQEAWHAGRITSDDLVAGWRHKDREVVGISPGKTIPMLVELAEGSCLALVWPLLVEIAETLAAERATATTAAALEAILQFLPEVPHPVELPNIAALAERKGSSKAIKTARLIVAKL